MTIREELRLCAANPQPLSNMAIHVILFAFCNPYEYPQSMTEQDISTFLLLIAEEL